MNCPPAWYTLDVPQKDRTSVPLSRPAPMPERQPARSDRGLPDLGRGRIGGVLSCCGLPPSWHDRTGTCDECGKCYGMFERHFECTAARAGRAIGKARVDAALEALLR